jgi:hypothetical protein
LGLRGKRYDKGRRLHNEKLHDLYSSPITVWVIKSTRMRFEGQVVHMGQRTGAYKVWWGNLTESDHLEDLGIDMITYERIFKILSGESGLD